MVSLTQILLLTGCIMFINGQYGGRRRLPPRCAAVLCAQPDCPNPITLPGQCCPVCRGIKPGRCPRSRGFGICVNQCRGDFSCRGRQKCCRNGCGRTCQLPIGGGRPDCRTVFCTQQYCIGQYTPPGRCCPVCPRTLY